MNKQQLRDTLIKLRHGDPDRTPELRKMPDPMIDEAMQLIDQYAYEYAERVIGADIQPGTAWDREWVGRDAINIILTEQRKTNRELSSHKEEEGI